MNFVTANDFNLIPYSIPAANQLNVDGTIDAFISKQQDKALNRLFGRTFYLTFKSWFDNLNPWNDTTQYEPNEVVYYGPSNWTAVNESTGSVPSSTNADWLAVPADRWMKLLVGDAYQNEGMDYAWEGMKNICIPMIYALVMRRTIDTYTAVGIVLNDVENGTVVSSAQRISDAWNNYRSLALGEEYYPGCFGPESLFVYLYTISSTFDDVIEDTKFNNFAEYLNSQFKDPGQQNEFNL